VKRWKSLVFHSMKDLKNVFYSNIRTCRGRGGSGRTTFWSQHKSSHGSHHQHEGQPHGGGLEFEREQSKFKLN